MRTRSFWLLLPVLSAWWSTGCAPHNRILEALPYPSGGVAVAPAEVAELGQPLERGQILPDVSDLTQSPSDVTPPASDEMYLSITKDQCACTAAAQAEVANLIDIENEIAVCCGSERKARQQQGTALQSEMFGYRAAAERNRAAGETLELFFLLAEAEGGREALVESVAELDEMLADIALIREAGLEIDVAENAIDHRRAGLLDRETTLLLDRTRLNSELRRRLGLDVDDPTPIWPETNLKVSAETVDVNTAIATGMAMRPDVAAAQRLVECLGTNTLPEARGALQAFDAVLGSATGQACLLRMVGMAAENCEWARRQEQLERMLTYLQRAAAEEIRQAVHTVDARTNQVVIARDRLTKREAARDELIAKSGVEDVSKFEISDAKLKVIEARTDLLHHVVAWEIARVKLDQAQGLFALQCGYTQAADGAAPDGQAEPEPPPAEEDPDTVVDVPPPPALPFLDAAPPALRQPDSLASNAGQQPALEAAADSGRAATDSVRAEAQSGRSQTVDSAVAADNRDALDTGKPPAKRQPAAPAEAELRGEPAKRPATPRPRIVPDTIFEWKDQRSPVEETSQIDRPATSVSEASAVSEPKFSVPMKKARPRPAGAFLADQRTGATITRPQPANAKPREAKRSLSAPREAPPEIPPAQTAPPLRQPESLARAT